MSRAPGWLVPVAPSRAWRGSPAFRRPGPFFCVTDAPPDPASPPARRAMKAAMSDSNLVGNLVGKKAPALGVPDQDGKTVKLDEYQGRWVVLYFYPNDDTPGCTTEACDFTNGLPDFEKLEASI